jgi:hypothetical protein
MFVRHGHASNMAVMITYSEYKKTSLCLNNSARAACPTCSLKDTHKQIGNKRVENIFIARKLDCVHEPVLQ